MISSSIDRPEHPPSPPLRSAVGSWGIRGGGTPLNGVQIQSASAQRGARTGAGGESRANTNTTNERKLQLECNYKSNHNTDDTPRANAFHYSRLYSYTNRN
jgi:hypothetical protein